MKKTKTPLDEKIEIIKRELAPLMHCAPLKIPEREPFNNFLPFGQIVFLWQHLPPIWHRIPVYSSWSVNVLAQEWLKVEATHC